MSALKQKLCKEECLSYTIANPGKLGLEVSSVVSFTLLCSNLFWIV